MGAVPIFSLADAGPMAAVSATDEGRGAAGGTGPEAGERRLGGREGGGGLIQRIWRRYERNEHVHLTSSDVVMFLFYISVSRILC